MSDTTNDTDTTIIEKSKVTHHAWASKLPFPEGKDRKLIGTIIGQASGTKDVKAPNGDVFSALRGRFEATNADTGEITVGGICYLPSGFHDMVEEQIKALGDDPGTVEFAYRVWSVTATNPQKFSYAFEPMLKPRGADALAELRALVALKKPAQITNDKGKPAANKAA